MTYQEWKVNQGLDGLEREEAIVITKGGEVYRVVGDTGSVNISALGGMSYLQKV